MTPPAERPEERGEPKVRLTQDEVRVRVTITASGCWEWNGSRNKAGYGVVAQKGRRRIASRCAYEAFVGSVPDDMFVCHRCDNPPCVNPEHLFLGSQRENMQDCLSKGRYARLTVADRPFCPAGHPVNDENTFHDRAGRRRCRVCAAEQTRRYRERHPERFQERERKRPPRIRRPKTETNDG